MKPPAKSYKDSRPKFGSREFYTDSLKREIDAQLRIYNLSKKASEDFLEKLRDLGPEDQKSSWTMSPKPKDLRIAELDDLAYAVIFEKNRKLFFGRKGEATYFPLLKDEVFLPALPRATVDLGAVKYVCNGANVMRPGIVSFRGNFGKSALIVVEEASHSKAIAVGLAMETAEDLQKMTRGPAIENYHYVGDRFWEALKFL